MEDLNQKKVCLITGASGILGNALCKALSKNYNIVGIYNSKHPNHPSQRWEFFNPVEPSTEVRSNSCPIYAIKADLTENREVERVVELALAKFDKVDILVNCAGIYLPSQLIGSQQVIDNTKKQFELNTLVPLQISSMLINHYWRDRDIENKAQNRCIINVSSIAGIKTYIQRAQAGYSASKAALNAITKHMAEEYRAIGIRANAVAPNSFPEIVSIEAVVEVITSIIESQNNGDIVMVDKNAIYVI